MTLHKTSSQIKNLKETYLTLRTEMANLGNQKLSLEISVLKSILNSSKKIIGICHGVCLESNRET